MEFISILYVEHDGVLFRCRFARVLLRSFLVVVLKAVHVSSDASDTESKKLLVLGSGTFSWCRSFWFAVWEVT